jgi:hypothetical protein
MTCYTLYTSAVPDDRCDCLLGPGAACSVNNVEVKTVQVPSTTSVRLEIPNTEFDMAFAFDHVTGGLYAVPSDDAVAPLDSIQIHVYIDNPRKLAVRINRSGRPQICTPPLSTMTEQAC